MTEIINHIHNFKIVVVGDSGVGKTSIIQQFCYNKFFDNLNPTIGSACINQKLETNKGWISLNIWDTAGQERFQSLIPMYLRGAKGCIIVVDISIKIIIDELNIYFDYLKDQLESNCIIILCANKSDCLKSKEGLLELENWTKSNDILFYFTSARTGEGLEVMFKELSNLLIENIKIPIPSLEKNLKINENEKSHSKCC